MLLLLPIPFLAVGCICFLLCAAIPVARRFALASSLWFAAWGGILLAASIVLMLIMVGGAAAYEHLHSPATDAFVGGTSQRWAAVIGIALLLGTAGGATAVTMLHGLLMRRITFFLFRLYLTAVAFGVGILVATPMSFGLTNPLHLGFGAEIALTFPLIPLMAGMLSWFCFRFAQDFRGKRPDVLNPVTPAEYGQFDSRLAK